jgi:hypothetical protein
MILFVVNPYENQRNKMKFFLQSLYRSLCSRHMPRLLKHELRRGLALRPLTVGRVAP